MCTRRMGLTAEIVTVCHPTTLYHVMMYEYDHVMMYKSSRDDVSIHSITQRHCIILWCISTRCPCCKRVMVCMCRCMYAADLSTVPSVEDGACAMLKCICRYFPVLAKIYSTFLLVWWCCGILLKFNPHPNKPCTLVQPRDWVGGALGTPRHGRCASQDPLATNRSGWRAVESAALGGMRRSGGCIWVVNWKPR